MSKSPAKKTAALEEERDLLRESLVQTLIALRDLEQEMDNLREDAAAHGRNRADRHMLKAMNELLEMQIDTQKGQQQRREGVLGRVMLDDAARIRTQGAEIEALQAELERIRNSRSWKLTSPLRSARGAAKG